MSEAQIQKSGTKPSQPRVRGVIATSQAVLTNQDPKRRYRLVYKAAREGGIEDYEAAGFRVERAQKGGVRISGVMSGDGEPIEHRGHVLMSIDFETAREVHRETQRDVDAVEKQIIRNRVGEDKLRGLARGGYVRVEPEHV